MSLRKEISKLTDLYLFESEGGADGKVPPPTLATPQALFKWLREQRNLNL